MISDVRVALDTGVRSLADLARMQLPPSDHAPGEVRRAVEDVLSRPEFRESQPSITDQALAWLSQQLNRFLALVAGNDVGQVVFSVLLAVAAFAVVIGFALFARRFRRSGSTDRAAVVGSTGRSAAEWEELATAAAASGNLREAVRCRYRALVAEFAARGLLDELPGRTAGQYLDAVMADLPEAAPAFRRATDLFERAWYGRAAVDEGDLREMETAVAEGRGALGATRTMAGSKMSA